MQNQKQQPVETFQVQCVGIVVLMLEQATKTKGAMLFDFPEGKTNIQTITECVHPVSF